MSVRLTIFTAVFDGLIRWVGTGLMYAFSRTTNPMLPGNGCRSDQPGDETPALRCSLQPDMQQKSG